MAPMDVLAELSDRIVALAARGAASVVRVEGRRRGAASGVVFSADGVVLAANHALERDEDVGVELASGETATGDVIGRDPATDLALLRIGGVSGLVPPEWGGEERVAAGQLVLGIARSERAPRVALASITRVGGEFRGPGGGRFDRYVETSLDVRQGTSGSLVLAADGSALGVALAGSRRGPVLAVTPPTLRRVAAELLAHGEVRRGYLGLAAIPVPLPAPLRSLTGESLALLVSRVEADSPAARAGILLGDALLSFGGETLQDPSELLGLLAEDRIGEAVSMKLLRAGEVRDVTVTVGERPREGRR